MGSNKIEFNCRKFLFKIFVFRNWKTTCLPPICFDISCL